MDIQDFTKPSGIVTAQVCKESGKLAIAGVCDADPRGSQVYTEYFAEGTQPTEYCDHHIVANICNASGQLAGGYCPADSISSRVFVIGGTVGTRYPYLLTDDLRIRIYNAQRRKFHLPGTFLRCALYGSYS